MKQLFRIMTVCAAMIAVMAASGWGEELRVGGGGSPINFVIKPLKKSYEEKSGNTLTLIQSTPGKGVQDLVEGRIQLAVSAVGMENVLAEAEKNGAKINKDDLKVAQIGVNRFVLMINKDNPVATLTKEQVKGIFTGKIQNWKDVGGPDMPVLVVLGQLTPGQNTTVKKTYLDGEEYTKDVLSVTDQPAITEAVSVNKEAIGINPIKAVSGNTKVVESKPYMETPYIAIWTAKSSPSVQKLIDYIKENNK